MVAKVQRELWASNCFYWDSVSSWATKIFGLSRSEEINMALDEAAALWCSSPFVQGEDFAKLCDLDTSAVQSESCCSFYTDIFSFDFWGQWTCHYYHYYFIKTGFTDSVQQYLCWMEALRGLDECPGVQKPISVPVPLVWAVKWGKKCSSLFLKNQQIYKIWFCIKLI